MFMPMLLSMKEKIENKGDTKFLFRQWKNGKEMTPELLEAAQALKEEKERLAMKRFCFWFDVNLPIILKSIGGTLLTVLTVYLTKIAGG